MQLVIWEEKRESPREEKYDAGFHNTQEGF